MPTMKMMSILLAAGVVLTACSTSADNVGGGPSTVTVTASPTAAPSTTVVSGTTPTAVSPTPSAASGVSCAVNAAEIPIPTAEPYQWVPEAGRVSVEISGLPSGTIKPGDPPAEVEVTVCNDSAVSYPGVGFVAVFDHCSCAPGPSSMPKGAVEYFDEATGSWTQVERPAAGTGMDYLGQVSNVRELPKGGSLTVRYRIALDGSMTAGDGSLTATIVNPEPLNQLGAASLPFKVVL